MGKVFLYECLRMLKSKLYLAMGGLLLAFAYIQVSNTLIYGVYHTAPYSEWTFVTYLSKLLPLLLAVPLYYIGRLYSLEERDVRRLTQSAPMQAAWHMGIKCLSILVGFLVLVLLISGLAILYYLGLFGFTGGVRLFGLCLLFLIPPFLLCCGVGMWLGRKSAVLVYALIAVLALISFMEVRLPMAVDILGTSILTLGETGKLIKGKIAFAVPQTYLIARIGMSVIGVMLMALACKLEDRKG